MTAAGPNNLLAIAAMLGAGFFYVSSDACLRLAAAELPLGQIVAGRSAGGGLILALAACLQSAPRWHPALLSPAVALRVLGETGAALFFIAAIVRMPFANAAAIIQFIPLITTLVAARLFAERVGWARWCAGAVGFLGVLLILQPGTQGFTWWSLLAVAAMLCMSLRDLATTRIDRSVPTLMIGTISAAGVMIGGLALFPFAAWSWPSAAAGGAVGLSSLFMAGGFYCMVQAMRLGEVSAVAPFRYATMLWALLAGLIIWNEVPNGLAMLGIVVVIGAGLGIFLHEQRAVRARTAGRRGAS